MNTDTSVDKEYADVRKVIAKDIRDAEVALRLLKEMVDSLSSGAAPNKYNIKEKELYDRKTFVEKATKAIQNIKIGLDSEAVRKKLASDKTRVKRSAREEAALAMNNQVNEENERFINDQRTQNKLMIKQQDQNLGQLDKALDRLKGRADIINEEIKDQEGLIDQLGKDIDKNQAELGSVQDALGHLLQTKDGCQIWTIVILAGVLILLVCLVIWA
jgi:vacuolar-type H+-ATPase subunit I/STV1